MKKVTIIFGILCATLFSCSHGDSYYSPDEILVDERVECEDSIILENVKELSSVVVGLYSIDHYLILVQNNRDSVLQVIDMNNNSFVTSFSKVGRARNEFQNIPQRVYCIKDEKGKPMLCIQENTCTKLVDIEKSVETSECVMSKVIKEKKDYLFDYTYHFAGNKCFNYKTVSYEDARDEIYNAPMFYMDDPEERWDVFPQVITPSLSNVVDCAYAMKVLVSPNGKTAVGIHHLIDLVTILDIEHNKSIGIVNSASYTLNDLESDFNENNIKEKLIWYNTSGCATDNCFMVIKDGDFYRNVAHEDSEDGTSVINCYDWNGEKRFSYVVNKKLNYIAYNDKTGVLYAISNSDILYSSKLKK